MIKFSVSATVIPGCLSFLELLKICDMLSPGRRGMGFAHRKIGKEMVSVFPLLQPCHWLNCRGTREVRWNISMSSHTYVHVAAPVNVWSHLIQPDQWQHNSDIDHGTRSYRMSHTFFKQCHWVTTFKQVCQFISVQHFLFYYNNFLEKIIILKVVTLFI